MGGMSEVFPAIDFANRASKVAVKLFTRGEIEDDILRETYDREIRAPKELKHPSIVELYCSDALPDQCARQHPSMRASMNCGGEPFYFITAAGGESDRVPRYARGVIRPGRGFVLVCIAVFGTLFVAGGFCAQQATAAPISIRVTDPAGAAVVKVPIRIVPSPDPAPGKMETDEKGQLALDLKPGGYALFVEFAGFKSVATHIEVQGTKEIQIIPVRLEIAPTGSPMVLPASSKDDLRVSAYPYHLDVFLKPAELKALTRTTVAVHNEHSKADEAYTGVRAADLLAKMGVPLGKDLRGAALSSYLVASGSDGYQVVIALAEVDPSFHTGEVLVADTMNGQPLDAKSGPFKLVVTQDKRPARWVRNLVSIELKSAK
jgi:hypothetical protein